MHEFAGLRAAVELAGIGGFDYDHARGFDAIVAGVCGDRDVVADFYVCYEAAALLHAYERFFAVFPFRHAHAPGKDARVHAHVGKRLCEGEGAAPCLAVLARLGGSAERHVALLLLGGSLFGDWAEREIVHEGCRGGAAVDPRDFVGKEGKRKILRPFDYSAAFGVERRGRHARGVKSFEHGILLWRPVVRGALAVGHEPRNERPRHLARAGHRHLYVVAILESPHDLADFVAR